MKKLAEKTVGTLKDAQFMSDLASTNQHLGGKRPIANPLKDHRFWCVAFKPNKAYTPRQFLGVGRSGTVFNPVDQKDLLKILALEDTTLWKDKEYLEAAALVVHLQAFSNEDGWKIVKTPGEFLAIEFNMHLVSAEKRQAAAQKIKAPEVMRKNGATRVSFHSWHLIGGELRRWEVVIGPKSSISHESLGSFGGGGYD
jgi:hypothetical protein